MSIWQGQEKDFIIFSAVRGICSDKEEARRGTVGFLGDMRRLNVAVTRGRVNLWLVGNGCFLRRDKTWARLYAYAKDRQALISISRRNAQHAAILTKWVLKYCKTHHVSIYFHWNCVELPWRCLLSPPALPHTTLLEPEWPSILAVGRNVQGPDGYSVT